MNWTEEVREGIHDVLAEFPTDVADALAHVPVVPLERWGVPPRWGEWTGSEIRIYRPAFDQMGDNEDRSKQVRDVLRHEFEHAMGVMHPGHDDRRGSTRGVSVLALGDGRYAVIP